MLACVVHFSSILIGIPTSSGADPGLSGGQTKGSVRIRSMRSSVMIFTAFLKTSPCLAVEYEGCLYTSAMNTRTSHAIYLLFIFHISQFHFFYTKIKHILRIQRSPPVWFFWSSGCVGLSVGGLFGWHIRIWRKAFNWGEGGSLGFKKGFHILISATSDPHNHCAKVVGKRPLPPCTHQQGIRYIDKGFKGMWAHFV